MPDNYNCITFHTPACCDEHQDRMLNVYSPDGLDDECPICALEAAQRDYAQAQHDIGEYVDKTAELQAKIERLAESRDNFRELWCEANEEVDRLKKRHSNFLTEFWATNAENERLQYEAIGWAWAEACGQLDLGLDPREYDIANLAERAKTELAAIGEDE